MLCAYGDATTRVKDEASRSVIRVLADMSVDEVIEILDGLSESVRSSLAAQNVPAEQQQLNWQADVRYQGQALVLTQEVDPARLREQGLTSLTGAFDEEHERQFTFALSEAHELVNLRAIARAPRPSIADKKLEAVGGDLARAVVGEQVIYYAGASHTATLYDRAQLCRGQEVPGPAIAFEIDSTTVILPGYHARVDDFGNLLIRPQDAQEQSS